MGRTRRPVTGLMRGGAAAALVAVAIAVAWVVRDSGPDPAWPSPSGMALTGISKAARVGEARVGRSPTLRAYQVASGLDQPVGGVAVPSSTLLYVLERHGRIRLVGDGIVDPPVVLDLTSRVLTDDSLERGLVGIALHPAFTENGRVFLAFTDHTTDLVIAEYRAVLDDAIFDPDEVAEILRVEQPGRYHHGGSLLFGPDGYLWIGLGDGGDPFNDAGEPYDDSVQYRGADPFGHGQDPHSLLATLIRIDVDSETTLRDGSVRRYAIPDDNPFADSDRGAPEVWAYGLRNPWRFTFDDGLIYIADVGENTWEEINILPIGASSAANFGWPVFEGLDCMRDGLCELSGRVDPVEVLANDEACAVIGGVVYRGSAIPELRGSYFYADFCSSWIRSLRFDLHHGSVVGRRDWSNQVVVSGPITSFIVDAVGEMYVSTLDGSVYLIGSD